MTQSECFICGVAQWRAIERYERLPRVTSDCLPFPAGGKLGVCLSCGAVTKRADASWREEIARIYSGYEAYRQGDGHEQKVRDPLRGDEIRPRSALLLDRVKAVLPTPQRAAALDVGCGSGVMLAALADALPGWDLDGFDLDDRALARLQAIPGFRRLHTGAPSDIAGRYRLITLIHSLEHFGGDLVEPLRAIVALLEPDGGLFVEVPYVELNLFDILVADHLVHFDHAALRRVARRAGLAPLIVTHDWLGKELSMVAQAEGAAGQSVTGQSVTGQSVTGRRVTDAQAAPWAPASDPASRYAMIQARVDWLTDALAAVRTAAARGGPIGVFGSAIAATWIAGALDETPRGAERETVSFFIDDDPNRQGRAHLDRPILSLDQVPDGATVIVPMEPGPAAKVGARLAARPLSVITVTQN